MKNIAQNRETVNSGDGELRGSDSRVRRVMNLPRALLGYLGKIASDGKNTGSDLRRTKNYIRGRIAYK